MSGLFPADQPDRTKIRLRLMDENLDITRFVSYEVTSDFLTPSDGWHFVIADEALPETTRDKLKLGTEVALFVGGNQVLDGHIDSVEINASRSSGWQWTIAGRDNLGFVVDATADPTLQFKEGATLFEFLRKLFTPFGWVTDEQYSVDASADRQATTGIRAIKESKGGKKEGPEATQEARSSSAQTIQSRGAFRLR
jgi:prophage tail gpP-like protein